MSRRISVTRRVNAGLAMLAAGAVLAGCGAASTASSLPAPSVAAGTTGRPVPAVGIALRTIDGATVHVPSSKPTVLAYIAMGCADCAAAAKAAGQASHTLGSTATVLAVDLDPGAPASEVNAFLDYVGAKGLPVVVDDTHFDLSRKYAVTALSSVIVIDPAGKVTYRAVNPSADAITAAVAQSS